MDNPVKDNLKKLMYTDSKISEGELSRKTGVPQSTIHRILAGQIKESKPSTLRPLANYFGIRLAQLQGEEPMPMQRQPVGEINTSTYPGTPAPLIPLITWEQAAQWSSICQSYQHESSKGWVATNKDVGPNAFGLRIQGNSMTSTHGPSFEDGCEVVVDPDRIPQHHDFVIVVEPNKQSAILRQLSIEGNSFDLFPLNPRYHVTHIEDLNQVCGVVCQLLANF